MKQFIYSSLLIFALATAIAVVSAFTEAAKARTDEPGPLESSVAEIRAIVENPNVAAKIGDRAIEVVRHLGRGGYELKAGGCTLTIQVGYEIAEWPLKPSVHIEDSTCF